MGVDGRGIGFDFSFEGEGIIPILIASLSPLNQFANPPLLCSTIVSFSNSASFSSLSANLSLDGEGKGEFCDKNREWGSGKFEREETTVAGCPEIPKPNAGCFGVARDGRQRLGVTSSVNVR